VSVSFVSNARPNSDNQFTASPDFSATPMQGSSHLWSGFADFSVDTVGTAPTPAGELELARRTTDQEAVAAAGALSPTVPGALAQTFLPVGNQTLGSVDLVLSSAGPAAELTVSIRSATAGLPTGPDLATTTIAGGSVPVSPGLVTAAFPAPPALLNGQSYAIVLEGGSAWQLAQPYAGGAASSSNDGVTFVPEPFDLAFATHPATGALFETTGTQTSAILDLGSPGPDTFLALTWLATVPATTEMRFQLAVSNSATDTAISTFVGPDGTAATFYATPASPLWAALNGKQYVRYRAYLATTDPGVTPTLTNLRLSWDRRPAMPTNLAPVGASGPTPTFTWTATDADGDTLSYRFQIASDPGFLSLIEQRVNLRVPSHTLGAPLLPGTYYWRAASFDGVLQGDWATSVSIVVT
jgi:hypothetical protein